MAHVIITNNEVRRIVYPGLSHLEGYQEIADDDARLLSFMATLRAEAVTSQKRLAYQNESDPLFFKWQAGEGTEQAWLDKRAEIDARFA